MSLASPVSINPSLICRLHTEPSSQCEVCIVTYPTVDFSSIPSYNLLAKTPKKERQEVGETTQSPMQNSSTHANHFFQALHQRNKDRELLITLGTLRALSVNADMLTSATRKSLLRGCQRFTRYFLFPPHLLCRNLSTCDKCKLCFDVFCECIIHQIISG